MVIRHFLIDRFKLVIIFFMVNARSEPRLELGVHVFGIMWNYFGIH